MLPEIRLPQIPQPDNNIVCLLQYHILVGLRDALRILEAEPHGLEYLVN